MAKICYSHGIVIYAQAVGLSLKIREKQEAGGTKELFRMAKKRGMIAEQIGVREAMPKLPLIIEGSVKTLVDHSLRFNEARDASKQDYTDSNIRLKRIIGGVPYERKDFKEEVLVEIGCFGKRITSEHAIIAFDAAGYRSATLAEVFAFAATPEGKVFQEKFEMVNLSTKFRDGYGVIILYTNLAQRKFSLDYGLCGWYYWFLVVRKSQ